MRGGDFMFAIVRRVSFEGFSLLTGGDHVVAVQRGEPWREADLVESEGSKSDEALLTRLREGPLGA